VNPRCLRYITDRESPSSCFAVADVEKKIEEKRKVRKVTSKSLPIWGADPVVEIPRKLASSYDE